MRLLDRYLLGQFLGLFLPALVFFVLSIVLADLLVNLSRLVPLGIGLGPVLTLSWLYLPQALAWSLPPALLFSVSFVLGTLYANNELAMVFGSGLSLARFTGPLFLVGALLSAGLFFWNDRGVVGAEAQRQDLSLSLQGESSRSSTNAALLAEGGRLLYSAAFYNDQTATLTGLVLVWKDGYGALVRRVDADWAVWTQDRWVLHKVRTYEPDAGGLGYRYAEEWTDPSLSDPPSSFQRKTVSMNQLTFAQALDYVRQLRRGGLPSAEAETEALQRLSFSLAPFVVVWIAAAVGGRFRKNILLMSLLTSLLVSAGYIVVQMVFGLLAKTGVLPPWVGAGAGLGAGLLTGFALFIRART